MCGQWQVCQHLEQHLGAKPQGHSQGSYECAWHFRMHLRFQGYGYWSANTASQQKVRELVGADGVLLGTCKSTMAQIPFRLSTQTQVQALLGPSGLNWPGTSVVFVRYDKKMMCCIGTIKADAVLPATEFTIDDNAKQPITIQENYGEHSRG